MVRDLIHILALRCDACACYSFACECRILDSLFNAQSPLYVQIVTCAKALVNDLKRDEEEQRRRRKQMVNLLRLELRRLNGFSSAERGRLKSKPV